MPKSKPTKAQAKAKVSTSTSAANNQFVDFVARLFTREALFGALVAEVIGTFILTSAVLITSGNIFIAALTLIILAMALSKLSGGHVNPAVTIAMLATRQISALRAGGYIVAQLLGAMVALIVVTQFVQTTPVTDAMQQMIEAGQAATPEVFTAAALEGEWRPFLAELLGATIFGVGLAAAVLGKKEGMEAGFVIGGSLFLGLLLATQGSGSILNPAVALGLNAYQSGNGLWAALTYAIAPVLGVTAGAWLYKLARWDVDSAKIKS